MLTSAENNVILFQLLFMLLNNEVEEDVFIVNVPRKIERYSVNLNNGTTKIFEIDNLGMDISFNNEDVCLEGSDILMKFKNILRSSNVNDIFESNIFDVFSIDDINGGFIVPIINNNKVILAISSDGTNKICVLGGGRDDENINECISRESMEESLGFFYDKSNPEYKNLKKSNAYFYLEVTPQFVHDLEYLDISYNSNNELKYTRVSIINIKDEDIENTISLCNNNYNKFNKLKDHHYAENVELILVSFQDIYDFIDKVDNNKIIIDKIKYNVSKSLYNILNNVFK